MKLRPPEMIEVGEEVERLMSEEAKKAFEKAINERRESVAREAVSSALKNGRSKAEETDIRNALKRIESRPSFSLPVQIGCFLASFVVFEVICLVLGVVLINIYLLPVSEHTLTPIGAVLAAAISAGVALSVAFYKYILRDRLLTSS